MIRLELKPEYFALAAELLGRLQANYQLRRPGGCVIGIGGESGSGKSITAACLAIRLADAGLTSTVIHQDDYFRLPPRANHERRSQDLGHVGPQEVDLELLASHLAAFREGRNGVRVPVVDYPADRFVVRAADFVGIDVLLVEGTYVLTLADLDVRVFLTATHRETRDRRRRRNRDVDSPLVDQVLRIEHRIIRRQLDRADIIIGPDFTIGPAP